VNLLRGQSKNDKTDLQFDDHSVKEPYDSTNADYIQRNIREKIDHCSVTLVYLTDKTASSKWGNWEIEESLKRGSLGAMQPARRSSCSRNSFLSTRSQHMSLLATCPDDVSILFNSSDTFWRRVAEDDIFEKRVDKTGIYRHDGGYANGSPRATIAPTASSSDNARIPGHWLNSQ
jgi:hypothetical protein